MSGNFAAPVPSDQFSVCSMDSKIRPMYAVFLDFMEAGTSLPDRIWAKGLVGTQYSI